MAWTGSTHCTTTSERRRPSLDALPKGWLMLLSVMMLALFLSLPSLACAGDSYSDELRLLDLELECRRSNPRCFRSSGRRSRPRAGRLQGSESSCTRTVERDIAQGYSGRYKAASPVLELDHLTVLDPEPLFTTMRQPWLQPADRFAPMPEEQRARMWCVINDCWLNQTP